MKQWPLGIQIYNLRQEAEQDFAGTMQAVARMGWDFVELAGLYGLPAAEVSRILAANGLKARSAHVPFAEMKADLAQVIRDYQTIGCDYIAIPYLPDDLRPLTPGYQTVLDYIPVIAQAVNQAGMKLLYHNHDFEFVRLPDGRYALDSLYAAFSPRQLQMEGDTCWFRVAGVDPAAYLRQYSGRVPLVHLKDFYKEGQASNMYELIGTKVSRQADKTGHFEFRPLGQGQQDFPAILAAAEAAGSQALIYEQDQCYQLPPLEAARQSLAYLHSLGL
ncbi:MAG: sugar phosphate isomerase/epimerase [Oscillospiraceae bacterium]|nr:sugar phosphate isomerase/epimerase [Oscillospiraceae bacterium]MDD4368477.1 sugar phosphate isomerase/epimerase [Oscillospiraceae bacterium]